jgi:hypothetical protein
VKAARSAGGGVPFPLAVPARAQSVVLCFIETKVNSEGWQGRRVGRERKREEER